MNNWTEKREMVRVAKLYYFKGLTQAEIAKKVGVSRPVISKLLQKAKDTGIVEIIIKDETANVVEVEQRLESAFDLEEALVVPVSVGESEEIVKQLVGKAAALHVASLVRHARSIGISWGTTLYHLVNDFPYEKCDQVTVLPLVGGMGPQRIEIHSNQLAYELAKRVGGTCRFLYAPAIVETVELKQQLLQSPDIRTVLDDAKSVDVAVVGIGNPFESTMVDMGYLKQEEIEQLREHQAVADIGSRFVDARGQELPVPLNSRVIGIELADLRTIPTVIGVAAGRKKADAILAALRGKYFTKIVLDEPTAMEILRKMGA